MVCGNVFAVKPERCAIGIFLLGGFLCNKKYVLWNVHLPNALHSVCLNRLSCTEVGIYNNANSPNGFLTTAVT